MAQTQRTIAEINSLLLDNTVGLISPQDLRDALETWRPRHGQLYVAAAGAGAVTISDTTNYFEALSGPTWTLDSGASHEFDMSQGNGRLTYTGVADVMVHIACTLSFTCANNNRLVHARLGVSGTPSEVCEVQRWVTTATDVGSTALHLITNLSQNDYISLFFRNATVADNITVEVANLQCMSMPT